MNNILIIILGCSILNILHDRINTSVNFVNNLVKGNQYEIDWLLTGGVKDPILKNKKTEAEIMYGELIKYDYSNIKSNYIFDFNSTNTAENFVFVSKFIKEEYIISNKNYSNVYIVTSEFHQPRANLILSKIIPKNNFTWITAPEETEHLRFWEKYHVANVDRDVERALGFNEKNDEL